MCFGAKSQSHPNTHTVLTHTPAATHTHPQYSHTHSTHTHTVLTHTPGSCKSLTRKIPICTDSGVCWPWVFLCCSCHSSFIHSFTVWGMERLAQGELCLDAWSPVGVRLAGAGRVRVPDGRSLAHLLYLKYTTFKIWLLPTKSPQAALTPSR